MGADIPALRVAALTTVLVWLVFKMLASINPPARRFTGENAGMYQLNKSG